MLTLIFPNIYNSGLYAHVTGRPVITDVEEAVKEGVEILEGLKMAYTCKQELEALSELVEDSTHVEIAKAIKAVVDDWEVVDDLAAMQGIERVSDYLRCAGGLAEDFQERLPHIETVADVLAMIDPTTGLAYLNEKKAEYGIGLVRTAVACYDVLGNGEKTMALLNVYSMGVRTGFLERMSGEQYNEMINLAANDEMAQGNPMAAIMMGHVAERFAEHIVAE